MEKICYLVWKPEGVDDPDFRDQLTGETAKQILAAGAHKLSVICQDETTEALAKASIRRERDGPIVCTTWVVLDWDCFRAAMAA